MRRLIGISVWAVAILSVAPASPASALTNADLACQAAIGSAARSFAAAKHKAIVECNNVTVGGRACNLGRRDKRMLKAADTLARTVTDACRNVDLADLGFPGACFDPTFGDFEVGDLVECLRDTHASVVDFVFIPVEYPGAAGLFGTELRCQRTLGRAGQTFVARKLRARAQCLNDQLKRRISADVECRAEVSTFGGGTGDKDTDGRLIAAVNGLRGRLLDACSGVTLEHLGFPSFCNDFDGPPFDVDDLRSCVGTSHELLADQLLDFAYPPNGSNPTPTPSETPSTPFPTPIPTGPCDFNRVTMQQLFANLDLGWTGLFHNQQPPGDSTSLTFAVTGCDSPDRPCGTCAFEGPIANPASRIDNHRCVSDPSVRCTTDDDCAGGPCRFFFGAPFGIAGGGVSACVVAQVDDGASGAFDAETGDTAASLGVVARVSAGPELSRPCPVCVDDLFPSDGQPDGTCIGGARDGDKCDVNASSFSFGETSLDCVPKPANLVATLPLAWDLTTGTSVRTLSAASPNCTDFGATNQKCFCGAATGSATRPNACFDDTSTPFIDESQCLAFGDDGFCPALLDQSCASEPFRGCLDQTDCPAPGDFCVTRNRPCYPDNGVIGGSVSATGFPSPFFDDFAFPGLAGLFCVGPTSSAALNVSAGLPGLGRLRDQVALELSKVVAPFCGDGRLDAGESCDPPGTDSCPGGATCQTDCSCDQPVCATDRRSLTLRATAGSDYDYGWTGIAHNQSTLSDARLPATLACNGSDCTIESGTPVGGAFVSPLPLAAGGVATCVVTRVRAPVTGTYDCTTGCGARDVAVTADVFLVLEQREPCPLCLDDVTANDGSKDGFCDGGATPGASCDVSGTSTQFGSTSGDCLPAGSSVGELDLDLALTTGTASLSATVDCLSGAFPSGSCHCPGQVQPHACLDGVCPASGVCEQGPIDGICSNQRFFQCRSGTGTEDCEDVFPGAGTCVDVPRPCFGPTIERTGTCGVADAALAAVYCMPATRAAAINTTAGLPGPAALSLPITTTGCTCAE